MNNARLLQDAMGLIDEAIIDKAANTYVTKRRVSRWPGIIAAAAAVVALVILIVSSIHPRGEKILQAKYYTIYNNDGIYSMDGGLSEGSDGLNAAIPGHPVRFMGLSEMRRIIFEGQLSDNALRAMKSFKRARNGGILLFNPNHMQDIVVPKDMWVNGLVIWLGYKYSFSFENDEMRGSLTYCVIDESQECAEREINKAEKNIVILSATHDPERNATVTVFQNTKNQRIWKQIVYTHTAGNRTITFVENYHDGAEQEMPNSIKFWGTDNGNYFYGDMSGMNERPSLEYLMEFGLKPFVEE
jgi:hypothetical protein